MNSLIQTLKLFKFKTLKKATKKNQTPLIEYEIHNRELLKILYLISFEERLQNNSLNRSSLNLLGLLNLNVDRSTNSLLNYNQIFKNLYNTTISINLLYKLFKTQKV
jgi:hypothetical protein